MLSDLHCLSSGEAQPEGGVRREGGGNLNGGRVVYKEDLAPSSVREPGPGDRIGQRDGEY